jgi:hypothetical protein
VSGGPHAGPGVNAGPGASGGPALNGGQGPEGARSAHPSAPDAPATPGLPRRERSDLPQREQRSDSPQRERPDLPQREQRSDLPQRKRRPRREGSLPQRQRADQPERSDLPQRERPERQEASDLPRRERPAAPVEASIPPVAPQIPPARTEDQTGESPIFEEMASAWFRENWEAPPNPNEARLAPGPEVPAPPLPPTDGDGDGWDSGEPVLTPFTSVEPSELTSAGLPKRRRGSQLIPGGPGPRHAPRSAGPAETPSPFEASVPVRSAERVRGRLASYQQGVRQGRQSRHRAPEPDDVRTNETFEEM